MIASNLSSALDYKDKSVNQKRTNYSLTNNVEYMISSNLSSALDYKDKSVSFYPVIYIETGFQKLVTKEFGKFISGIILASTTPERIMNIEENIKRISMMFDRKPIKYIVYTCDCAGGGRESLADTVIDATLSLSTKAADGIIIYVDITNPVIQPYLHHLVLSKHLGKSGYPNMSVAG